MIDGFGDSPQLALDRLDPQGITFARELQGLTKKELATKVGKTSSAVSQIERGLINPDLETLVRISLALSVPTTFFMHRTHHNRRPIQLDACHFRAKRATSQLKRRQSARMGDLLIEFVETLERKGIVFPEDSVSSFARPVETVEDIERAASDLRRYWGMGFGPIPNMTKLLESKGIFVLPINDMCEDVDAYSTWIGRRPCVMLTLSKTASRARFDAAHELGHLVMHESAVPGDSKMERQADRFAGAFLAPRDSFRAECPRRWSLEAFRKLKFRWKLSIQALIRRAHDLSQLSNFSYRRAFMELGRIGYRKNEGEEWPKEQPSLLTQALELLQDQVTLDEFASELTLYSSHLRNLLQKSVSPELLVKLDRKADDEGAKIVSLLYE